MLNAIKVLCVFSKPFWPEDFFDIICTGAPLVRLHETVHTQAVSRRRLTVFYVLRRLLHP